MGKERSGEGGTRINKMLTFDEKRNLLEDPFLGVRVLAIDANFYKGLRNRLHGTFKSGASTILYEMGLGYGELMGRLIIEEGESKFSVYKDFMGRGLYMGFGRVETPIVKMIISGIKGELVVKLEKSFFATAMGFTGEPECYIFAGMVAGAARLIMGKSYDCAEERCVSKGDKSCEFRLVKR